MSMVWKGIPIPTIVGLILLIVGGIIHIIGIATPYWHEQTITTSSIRLDTNAHYGLWVDCNTVAQDYIDCTSSGSKDYLVATRALEILALLLGAVCIIVCGLWYFLKIEKFRLGLMIITLATGFLSGLFGIIGIIVYGIEINSAEPSLPGVRVEWSLSWSFSLCVVSSIMVFIATGLIAFGTRVSR